MRDREPINWRAFAACKDVPAELFRQDTYVHKAKTKAQALQAKAICATCPVLVACRDHYTSTKALEREQIIAGGMTSQERRNYMMKKRYLENEAKLG